MFFVRELMMTDFLSWQTIISREAETRRAATFLQPLILSPHSTSFLVNDQCKAAAATPQVTRHLFIPQSYMFTQVTSCPVSDLEQQTETAQVRRIPPCARGLISPFALIEAPAEMRGRAASLGGLLVITSVLGDNPTERTWAGSELLVSTSALLVIISVLGEILTNKDALE